MRIRIFICSICLILSLAASGCSSIIQNQKLPGTCFIYGQIKYNMPNMVEEGLRELSLINLQTKSIYNAETSPYEYGFYVNNIPPGPYAVYYAKWIFIDANAIALFGVNRQVAVELKFNDRSYSLSTFEAKSGEIKLAGSYIVNHNKPFTLLREYNDRLFVFFDKLKTRMSGSGWEEGLKKEIEMFLKSRKKEAIEFLHKKFPKKNRYSVDDLIKLYLK